jgi:two-component system, OmpR family, response regulator RegX3
MDVMSEVSGHISATKGAVLVVEDEHPIADLLRAYLTRDGFEPVWVRSGEDALTELGRRPFRLVVLDIGLPGIDGFEVCRRIRARTGVPILIVTAREDEIDRVAGLEVGADDYVVKPFSPREVVARVNAILRRGGGPSATAAEVLNNGRIELRRDAREAFVDGAEVDLTSREFDLLAAFLAHPGVLLSRERLLELVWGGGFAGGTRTVDVHVAQLRRKLGDAAQIQTVRGIGYKLRCDED